MADKATAEGTPEPRKSLGSFSDLPGLPLEEIEDQEVEVTKIVISTKRLRDNPEAKFAVIDLADGRQVHTWSPYLIEKLEQVPEDALPAPTVFSQETTANKRQVWTLS